jgi:hypothetical protein
MAKQDGKPEGVKVIYRPQSGDPVEVMWNNHRFRANEPTVVRSDGMIELAKGNPFFEVEGEEKAQVGRPAKPKTAEEYRSYAVRWFKSAKTAAELEQRWGAEEELRKECGVGTDDIEYLSSLYDPRLAELKKAEG